MLTPRMKPKAMAAWDTLLSPEEYEKPLRQRKTESDTDLKVAIGNGERRTEEHAHLRLRGGGEPPGRAGCDGGPDQDYCRYREVPSDSLNRAFQAAD